MVNAVFALGLLIALALAPTDMTRGEFNFWGAVGYLAMLEVMATLLNLVPMPGLDGYGIVEPYLAPATRRSLANIAPYGMMIVFLLLFNSTVNSWFYNLIARIMEPFGYAPYLAYHGYDLFHFFHFSLGGFGTG
jgi:Zn-dependent protease